MAETRPTLIVGVNWVGDMVMLHSFVQALRQHDDSQFDLITRKTAAPIGKMMPEITNVIVNDSVAGKLNFRYMRKLARELEQTNYAKAYVIPNSIKAALLPWLAKIPLRFGWRGEMRFGLINRMRMHRHLPRSPHKAAIMAAHAYPQGSDFELLKPNLSIDATQQAKVLAKYNLKPNTNIISFAPGAHNHASGKLWPWERYAQLGIELAKLGFQIVLTGSERERQLAEKIAAKMDVSDTLIVAGEIDLVSTGCLIAACTAVVANDSGLMHLAASLGVTIIGIFGPTSTAEYFPLGERASYVAPAVPGPIEQITVEQVLAKVVEELERA